MNAHDLCRARRIVRLDLPVRSQPLAADHQVVFAAQQVADIDQGQLHRVCILAPREIGERLVVKLAFRRQRKDDRAQMRMCHSIC